MGSRRRRNAALASVGFSAAAWAGGCAIGAPPGFSPGDSWTVPLIDPLADGRLLVPVTVHGKGPYLFVIDRDSETVVDPQVATEAGIRATGGVRLDDYHDTTHQAYTGELTDFEVGTLTLSLVHVAILTRPHLLDEDGRRVHGILGRDFLADSLVFGFDRDRGIAFLQTQQAFKPPAGASVLELAKVANNGAKVLYQPVIQDAKIGGVEVDVHPDFGTVPSSLVAEHWSDGHLAPVTGSLALIDSSGTTRHVERFATGDVHIRDVARDHVTFVPYEDRRFPLYHLDGTLGLDFFAPYAVAADWHHQKIYVTPRAAVAATRTQRLARWGAAIPACSNPGCVQLELAISEAGPVVTVRPDAGLQFDLEVIVAATAASGEALPSLIMNLPVGTDGFDARLAPRYAGAKLEVVDASPFPRQCPTTQGCLMTQSALPR